MTVYCVYANGQEFGIDYPTLEAARVVKAAYAPHWPHIKYYIRKVLRGCES